MFGLMTVAAHEAAVRKLKAEHKLLLDAETERRRSMGRAHAETRAELAEANAKIARMTSGLKRGRQ